jgi:hypothetical protein
VGKDLPSGKAALGEQLRHGLGWWVSLAQRHVVVREAGEQSNVLLFARNRRACLGLLFVRFLLLLFLLSPFRSTCGTRRFVFFTLTVLVLAIILVLG